MGFLKSRVIIYRQIRIANFKSTQISSFGACL
jgi:hypothetical protein